jgi:hypothetical protein
MGETDREHSGAEASRLEPWEGVAPREPYRGRGATGAGRPAELFYLAVHHVEGLPYPRLEPHPPVVRGYWRCF